MARQEEPITELLVEKVPDVGPESGSNQHPMVLSCGGIFIPRQRQKDVNDPIYKIINVPNSAEPTKVVCTGLLKNLLQEILHKESLN